MKIKAAGAVLLGVILSICAIDVASAHHPLLSGSTGCNNDGSWTVVWTVRADADRNLTWSITSPSGYGAAQADELPFRRQVTLPNATASVTENVRAVWSNGVGGSATATVNRPDNCVVPTTTTVVEEPTTTTTQPDATTTTVVEEPTTTTAPPEAPPTTVETATPPTLPPPVTTAAISTETTTAPENATLPATGAGTSIMLISIATIVLALGCGALYVARKPIK